MKAIPDQIWAQVKSLPAHHSFIFWFLPFCLRPLFSPVIFWHLTMALSKICQTFLVAGGFGTSLSSAVTRFLPARWCNTFILYHCFCHICPRAGIYTF